MVLCVADLEAERKVPTLKRATKFAGVPTSPKADVRKDFLVSLQPRSVKGKKVRDRLIDRQEKSLKSLPDQN